MKKKEKKITKKVTTNDKLLDAFKGALRKGTETIWCKDLIPLGILPLDRALGGGIGYGTYTEVYGGWSSGKSLLLYLLLAENQRRGGTSILFEAEGAYRPEWYTALGGDPDKLFLYRGDTTKQGKFKPLSVERAFAAIMKVIESASDDEKIIIGWDSLAATPTDHLLEAPDKRDMSKALAITQGISWTLNALRTKDIGCVLINQVREKINERYPGPTHTPGGHAWKYACTERLELKFAGGQKTSSIYSGDKVIGRYVQGEVTKSRQGPPQQTFVLPIYLYGGFPHPEFEKAETALGIDKAEALFMYYVSSWGRFKDTKESAVSNNGSWYVLSSAVTGGAQKNFRKREWLEVLKEYPQLWT